MSDYESLNHTKWECKYHVVFIPKCRRKVLYGKIRRDLGTVFRELAKQRESEILEGHLCPDHVHMMIRIPPKYSVSHVVGYIKGKSAIRAARDFMGRIKGSRATTFGHGGTSYRPWELMKARSASTFATRKRTTRNSTNSICFNTRKKPSTRLPL